MKWLAAAIVAVLSAALVVAHIVWGIPTPSSRRLVEFEITNAGLALQLVALVVGIVAVNTARPERAPLIISIQGAVCLLGFGWDGVVFAGLLVAWWISVGTGWFGRASAVLALLLVLAVDACAFGDATVLSAGRLFAMIFLLRLIVFTYDRWQHDFVPVRFLDFTTFALPAPLVIVPPYMAIISLFGGFDTKLRPGLTRDRLRRVARHAMWAAIYGGILAILPASSYTRFVANVVGLGTIGHALIALLLLHGIEERVPVDRPFIATRFVELWHRTSVHLKDAQVFLFYTPALLLLRRRCHRYVAIGLAIAWTMVAGNFLLHLVTRYVFMDASEHIAWGLAGNLLLAIALGGELIYAEKHGTKPRSWPWLVAGWLWTMGVAAIVAAT